MVLLLPVGSESAFRRPPRFTIAVIFLCALLFPVTRRESVRKAEAELDSLERIADWTLELAARSDPRILTDRSRHKEALGYLDADDSWERLVEDEELRARLETCRDDYRAVKERSPLFQYGLVPGRVTLTSLFSYQVLHGAPIHLFGNLLFLWAVGTYLESAWGTLAFALLYVASGLCAAVVHIVSHQGSVEPAVGAGGGVAGAMGAFAITFGLRQVPMTFVAMLAFAPRIQVIDAPAVLFPGLWIAEQLIVLMAALNTDIDIAVEAMIGGFVFGLLAAIPLQRLLQIDPDAEPQGDS